MLAVIPHAYSPALYSDADTCNITFQASAFHMRAGDLVSLWILQLCRTINIPVDLLLALRKVVLSSHVLQVLHVLPLIIN